MSPRSALMLAGTLASALILLPAASAQDAPMKPLTAGGVHPRFPISVLYAGRTDDPTHVSDWTAFLSEWFTTVCSVDYSAFTPKDADKFDVVIFDVRPRPTPGHIGLPKAPTLPADFNRASLCVAGGGAIISGNLNLKLDWL